MGKTTHIRDFVGLADDPGRVDEVGDAQGEAGALIVCGSGHLIPGTHLPVDVGQQAIAELLGFGEGLVVLRGIE